MGLKFYTDTHVDKQVAIQLRNRGVDIVRCQEVGLEDADDETHLVYAAQEDRILITFDKRFRDRAFEWMSQKKQHAGVFICRDYLQGPGGIGPIVKECLFYHEAAMAGAAEEEDFQGQVIDVE